MNIRINVSRAEGGLSLADAAAVLTGAGRIGLHAAMGTEVQHATFTHVAALERAPDSLASKLGFPTTNFYKHAAERIESPAALASSADAATLTLNYPGVGRAFHDITIVPTTAKSLAIPMDRIAFGRSPRDCWDELGLFIPKGKGYIAMRVGTEIKVLWLLRRSVTQRQNRDLLPSEQEWEDAAARGARIYLEKVL